MNIDTLRTDGSRGLPEAVEFRGEIALLFLDKTGSDVFPVLARKLGMLFPGSRGVFAYPDSLGTFAVHCADPATERILTTNEWKRLPGKRGWNGEPILISGFEGGDGSITVFPLIESGVAMGFAGWLHGSDSPPSDAAKEFLRSQIDILLRFTSKRVSLLRKEAFNKITNDAFAKSDRRFRDIIEDSRDMIYIADADGVINIVNRAAEDLLGIPVNEIIGRPFTDFCQFPNDRIFFNEKMAEKGFVRDFELILINRSGETVFVTESATAVQDANGRVIEIHGIVRDMTERLADQRELWKANMELVDLNETLKKTQLAMVQQEKLASLGQLAAGIAHEINNPLGFIMSDFGVLKKASAAIVSIVEMAKQSDVDGISALTSQAGLDYLASEMPSIFTEMDDGFQRISEIVKNLRSFTRVDASDDKLECNINASIEQALVIARNELKYSADVERALGQVPVVLVHPGEINQVFLNLIVNAAQAISAQNRPERGRITVSTGLGNGFVWSEIEDDGPGIDERTKTRIFEPFFTTKEPGKGTGLGLSISYDIITRKHGGTLAYRPSKTGGSIFRIELPLPPLIPPPATDAHG